MMRRDLGVSEFHANFISVITQAGYALGLLFIIPLGDLCHRKKIILTNFTLLIMSLTAIALSGNIYATWAGVARHGGMLHDTADIRAHSVRVL